LLQHRRDRLAQSPRWSFHRARWFLQPGCFRQCRKPGCERRTSGLLAEQRRPTVADRCPSGQAARRKEGCLISASDSSRMIVLGRLVAPYGVRGWFKLHPFADDPAAWCGMSQWWLAADAEQAPASWRAYTLDEVREHGKGLIVKLAGVDDRTAAEALQGVYVGAPREAMPEVG